MADTELESGVGQLLQAGIVLAGSVMLAGGGFYLARHGGEVVSYRKFLAVPPELRSLGGIGRGALSGRPEAVIQFGVLLMIATPVVRVAYAALGFARVNDWLYTGISLLVLSLLAWALLGAA